MQANSVNEDQELAGVPIETERQLTERKLDAAIAEHVMMARCDCDGLSASNPHGVESFCPVHGTSPRGQVPHYSTNIAAAMEIVEKVAAPGIHFMSDYLIQRNGERRWFVQFLKDGLTDGLHNEWVEAPTLPLAICRAALAAISEGDSKW